MKSPKQTPSTLILSNTLRLTAKVSAILIVGIALVSTQVGATAAVLEQDGKSIRINPFELFKKKKSTNAPAPTAPVRINEAKAFGAVPPEESLPDAAHSKPLSNAIIATSGPVKSEAPFLFAFMPDGFLHLAFDRHASFGFASGSHNQTAWVNEPKMGGHPLRFNRVAMSCVFDLCGNVPYVNSSAVMSLLKIGYGLPLTRDFPTYQLQEVMLRHDPGWAHVKNEFEARRLFKDRAPFYEAKAKEICSVRKVRYFQNLEIAGHYDFKKAGFHLVTRPASSEISMTHAVPIVGGEKFHPPSFLEFSEADAERLIADKTKPVTFVFAYEGDLISPEYQQKQLKNTDGMLAVELSNLTIYQRTEDARTGDKPTYKVLQSINFKSTENTASR